MIKINNNIIEVLIEENGGHLSSIKKDEIEYQWQGSKESWTGQDVVIFPFVARLKDGYYTNNGDKYELKNHGLIRYATLNIDAKTNTEVTLSYVWTQETIKSYPFKFEFYVNYKIVDNNLVVSYKVKNVDNHPLYFGIGGHPAFNLPLNRKNGYDDIGGNYIEFDKELDLYNYALDDEGSFIKKKEHFGIVKRLDLNKELFKKYKTLIFTGAEFNKLKLVRSDGKEVQMILNKPQVLAIWTKPDYGSYICIEPWDGIPDFITPVRELKDKELINKLDTDKDFEFSYTIKI